MSVNVDDTHRALAQSMQGRMWADLGRSQNIALCFHDLLYSLGPQQDEESVHHRPTQKRNHKLFCARRWSSQVFGFMVFPTKEGFSLLKQQYMQSYVPLINTSYLSTHCRSLYAGDALKVNTIVSMRRDIT